MLKILDSTWPWSKIRELQTWKNSYLEVERTWSEQEVGKELNVEWGASIRQNILPGIKKLKEDIQKINYQLLMKESLHEQSWLKQAAVFAAVDFNYIQSQVEQGYRAYNGELECAKECYRQGYASREFPEFLKLYRGQHEFTTFSFSRNWSV